MMPNGYKYQEIYKKAYNIMINNKIDKAEIPSKLPKNHILFGSIDLLYYINNNKNKINKYIFKNQIQYFIWKNQKFIFMVPTLVPQGLTTTQEIF